MSAAKFRLLGGIALVLLLAIGVGVVVLVFRGNDGDDLAPAHAGASKAPGVVYEGHFDRGTHPEWSSKATSITKKPKRKFLGPFRETPVTLTVDRLPPHQMIHVTFELLTYDRWNGDGENFGRDLWDMRVVGGQPLIHTTFSNCGFFSNNNEQSFPDQYPWYPTHPGWTGVATKRSLGFADPGKNTNQGIDSTYLFDITFPHTADTLRLQFQSQIKRHENKPYGFLSFKVETVDHPAVASDAAIAGWWQDLAGEDPVKAYHAVWSLVATGDVATAYIKAHLPPGDNTPPNVDQKAQWDYGSISYDTPAICQRVRAVHVLEAIGTPAANGILKEIGYAGTPQGGPPTRWDAK